MSEELETIFQVRINRKSQEFELVKTELSRFEQMGFENFLQSYLNCQKEISTNELKKEYFSEEFETDE